MAQKKRKHNLNELNSEAVVPAQWSAGWRTDLKYNSEDVKVYSIFFFRELLVQFHGR